MPGDKPVFGVDYDLERWSTGDHDAEGHLIWHHNIPNDRDWDHITKVTINFNPHAPAEQGDYRNYEVPPERPLDPWGLDDGSKVDWYDLDDLALQAFIYYGFEF